jgi:hypothetical protein
MVFAYVSGTVLCLVGRVRDRFKPSATINLEPELEYVHVFDAQSGRSLIVR